MKANRHRRVKKWIGVSIDFCFRFYENWPKTQNDWFSNVITLMLLSRGSSALSSGAVSAAFSEFSAILSTRLRFFFSTAPFSLAGNCKCFENKNYAHHIHAKRTQYDSTFFFRNSNFPEFLLCLAFSSAWPVEHSPFSFGSVGSCVSLATSFVLSDTFSCVPSIFWASSEVGDGGANHNGDDTFSDFLAITVKC